MEQAIRVAILGDSVLMEAVELFIDEEPHITCQSFGRDGELFLEHLEAFQPQIILYELGFYTVEELLSSSTFASAVRFVALDDSQDQILVMDGRQCRGITMRDLQHLIRAVPGAGQAALSRGSL